MNRRNFMTGMARTAALATLAKCLSASSATAKVLLATGIAADPRRPQFHFLPAFNWMNDPNAPIYFNGRYHIFYQYNPNGAYWGDMHWGHAISSDMVHWKHLPMALAPTPGGPDADGCFTGTAVLQDGRATILYTGVHAAPADQATSKDGPHSLCETQCLATSDDPELRTWSKLATPVISAPPPGMQVNGFRDPSPWRQGDWWYLVIGSGIANQGGAVLLYKSKDLRNWEYVSILAGRNQNGARTFDAFDPWEVWECPEFFSLGERHVLIYSTSGKAFWQSGVLDSARMTFRAEHSGILDYGSYYAPKTQLDQSGNRILWGWIPETRPLEEFKAAGWAGLMSLPRVLSMGSDGLLRIAVAKEIEQLRRQEQRLDLTVGENLCRSQIASMRLEVCSGEILLQARRGSDPFEMALCELAKDAAPWVTVQYHPLYPGQVSIDARPLTVAFGDGEDLEIRMYIDGSVIEVFVNEQIAITRRFYCSGGNPQNLHLRWQGKTAVIARLSLWQISPISADRLTT